MSVRFEAHALLMLNIALARVRVRLSVLVQRNLVVVVRAGVRRSDTLVAGTAETTRLLDLQATAAGIRVFGFGVPETAFVAAVVGVAAARTAVRIVSMQSSIQ